MEAAVPSGTVTFLFTDMEGSTSAWERHPDAMAVAQSRHDALLYASIESHQGYVFSTGGDGLAAAFADASQALAAAVVAQRKLALEPWPEPVSVRVRMGMHTGTAVERAGDYYGPSVIRAARLMSLVGGGRIVCSSATARAAAASARAGRLDLLPVGTVHLKGLTEAEEVYAVAGEGLVETGVGIEEVGTPGSRLPRAPASLVGREEEMRVLGDTLDKGGLVTLTGTAGIGKTRLALAAVQATGSFPDGIAWVDLASLSDGADVVQATADALGIAGAPGESLVTRLAGALAGRRMLVVLDNCDHVLHEAVDVVATILDAGPTVLATSRERLGVSGEHVVSLGPLAFAGPDSPAVRLLSERIGPDADAGQTRDLSDIACRLEGVPLGLELAAARCRTLGSKEVAGLLETEWAFLSDEKRQVERHRSLDAALAWSYDQLRHVEGRLLDLLSVFAGVFSIDAACAVAATAGPGRDGVPAALSSLVDKSLVVRQSGGFRLLVPTREFIERRRVAPSNRVKDMEAHGVWVRERLRTLCPKLDGPDEGAVVSDLDFLWPDVRLAIARAFSADDQNAVIEIVSSLTGEGFWRRPEVFSWISRAVERYGNRPGPHRNQLLAAAAWLAWVGGDFANALIWAEEAMASPRAFDTPLDNHLDMVAVGAYNYSGRHHDAARLSRRAAERAQTQGDLYLESFALANVSLSQTIGGLDPEQASPESSRALAIARALRSPTLLSFCLFVKGVTLQTRDPLVAAAALEEARAVATSVRNQWMLVMTTTTLAAASPGRGVDSVAALLEAADALYRVGWTTHAWTVLETGVEPLVELGRLADAALLLGALEGSNVVPFASHVTPSALLERLETDQQVAVQRDIGRELTLAQLLQALRSDAP